MNNCTTSQPCSSSSLKENCRAGMSDKVHEMGDSECDDLESLVMNHNVETSTPLSSSYSNGINASEEKMRRRLRFFFMNPIEKWQARRRFPLKFAVQVIKIILVTVQLCLFAHSRYKHVNYTWDNRVSFSHLFLKGWDATREVNAYPPAVGPLALYKVNEFFETLDFAVIGYANVGNAIGPYSYTDEDNLMPPQVLCLYEYKSGTIFGFNESYVFNGEIEEKCLNMTIDPNTNISQYSSRKYLKEHGYVISFSALVKAVLSFSLKTVNFRAAGPISLPDCYRFDIKINFNNEDHDGQMLLLLEADAVRLFCKGDVVYVGKNSHLDAILRSILNSLVIIICSISLILCSRAIYRAQQLKWITMNFFQKAYQKELSVEGRLEFLNLWYIMIIVNDILIILGSAIKEQIERKFVGDQWNSCSVFLGTGNLLVWFGLLRYLGFFKTYNVLILTLKKAAPNVARFLLCALLIYAGFTFCGWLILGPYHMKFRSLASTSECLFSLINGDDMYATFSIMSFKSPMLWWYSRVYLYCFISLYIYVVLSLFISVIMDAYETIKLYYKNGFPKSDLLTFVADCTDEASSGIYRSDSNSSITNVINKFCCCKNPVTVSMRSLR